MSNVFERISKTIKNSFTIMSQTHMAILPGQMAFFLLLSIIPVVTLIVALTSQLSLNTAFFSNFMIEYFPKAASDMILTIMRGDIINTNQIIFFSSAFLLASNATHSIIVASSAIYNAKRTNYIETRIKAIIMIFILVSLFIFVLFAIGFGSAIIGNLKNMLPANIFDTIYLVYSILKLPISFFIIFISIKLTYTIAPNKNIKSSTTNRGALFTTVMWLIVSVLYSYYVTNMLNWSLIYGALSNLIIFMFWIYLLSYIFVFGLTLNKHQLEKNEEESI